MTRDETRRIWLGGVPIGGGAPVSVQSMGNKNSHDAEGILAQMREVAAAGCDIFRLSVPDVPAVEALRRVCASKPLPVVADIHFDYRLALGAIEAGVDGLRINPGNIGDASRVRQVVKAAQARKLPIRIGVNGGSLEKDLQAKYGASTAEALVESALRHVAVLEAADFFDIKISVKASNVARTLDAYRLLAQRTGYPLHLGLTEAGTLLAGTVHSSVVMGVLLSEGIGDTIRVSLTADPVDEVRVGIELLKAVGLRSGGARVTSCPTCGRTEVDVIATANRVERELEEFYRLHPTAPGLHVAVMGCVVNGPGEAKEADLALCGGKGIFAVYDGGVQQGVLPEAEAIAWLFERIRARGAKHGS